jgi:hypothetical protein
MKQRSLAAIKSISGIIPRRTKKIKIEVTDGYVLVPISIGFDDWQPAIGHVKIAKEYTDLASLKMVLRPSFVEEQDTKTLLGFGLVIDNTTPPKTENGFIWHVFLISVVSGLLAIIGLIIKLYYIS